MRVISAYMLCVLGGKAEPTKDDISAVLKSVDVSADEERINALITAMKGKNIDEVIAAGMEKVGSAAAASAAPAAAAGGAAKKEESSSSSSSSSSEGGGFSLFD